MAAGSPVTTTQACWLKFAIIVAAGFFYSDFFPTHVDGAGAKVALALIAVQALIPTGDKTPQNLKDASADIDTAKRAAAVPVTVVPPAKE